MDKELENKLSDLEWVGTEIDKRISDLYGDHHDEDQREDPDTDDDGDPEYPESSNYTDDEW